MLTLKAVAILEAITEERPLSTELMNNHLMPGNLIPVSPGLLLEKM